MPITHATIPTPPSQVGQTEWAEEHTLPTAAEVGALTTASADARYVIGSAGGFVTQSSAADFLTSASASTVYARQVSAITTAQLASELAPYLTSASASTVYASQASAVTTAQLAVYLLSQDASTTYARQASAVTTAQLAVYLLSQDASTTYARQASAVTTAQLAPYLTSASASTVYAREASAVTTAQLSIYLLSDTASTTYARQVSALTTAQGNAAYSPISHGHSADNITAGVMNTARLGTGNASAGVVLHGDSVWREVVVSTINITEASADLKYLTSASADFQYGKTYVLTTDVSAASTILTTVNQLVCSVCASVAYRLEYALIYRSSATTTGLGIGVSVTPTPNPFMCQVDIYGFGADGTGGAYVGYASANGDTILGTSCNAAAIDMPCYVVCAFVAGTTGQAQLVMRSEVSNSNVLLRRGSSLRVLRLGAV